MEGATHCSKQTENCLHISINPRLPDSVDYIPMGFNDSNLKKVCEWFPPSFLLKEKVFAIQEVEPALLKLFTRVHETANKQGRKRGGRKVLLLGQEVFGDTFFACGRCGYHSPDNSNVRKHHRRKVCLVDRGYSRSQLRGMDGKERKNFLQQQSSRRYRERCKNMSQQQRVSEASADTPKPCQSQSPSSPISVVTTTNAISVDVPVSMSFIAQPVTTVGHDCSFTLPTPHATVHFTTENSDEVPSSSTSALEDRLAERCNAGTTLSGLVSHSVVGSSVKQVDCGDLLDCPSDDLLDRCAINSEMESCALLQNLTHSDLGDHRINDFSNCNNISSSGAAVGNAATIASQIYSKDMLVNPVTTPTDFVPHEGSKVLANLSSFSNLILDSNPNADGYFTEPVSSGSHSSNSILSLGHARNLSSKILKAESYGTAPKDQITVFQPSDVSVEYSPKTAVTNDRKGSSLNFNIESGGIGNAHPNANGLDSRFECNNSLADTSDRETIVLVPNCLPETTQPNLCIISMLEEGRGNDRTTQHESSLPAHPSPSYYAPSLQYVSIPSSSVQHSKKAFLVPSQISGVPSDKVLPQSEKDIELNAEATAGETQVRDIQMQTKNSVRQSLSFVEQSTNSVDCNSSKLSLANNSSANICQIIYAEDGKVQTMSSDLCGMDTTLQPTAECRVPTTTTLSLGGQSPIGIGCSKSSQSTDSLLQETPKRKAKKRKGLTLGPVEAREPIERLPYDLYTVNEHRQKVAWKPTFCHKAPSTIGCPPCQIAFRGARRCRRCLSLPLPCLLLYRKLDCRTHHCHFTLFHPHARHQQTMQGQAVRTTVGVRIYADTVMSQEFHHYLRSLWSCRLKPSQASRHITGVWAEVLRDRVAEYHLDLHQRQVPLPLLENHQHQELLKHRDLGTAMDPGQQGRLKRRSQGTDEVQQLRNHTENAGDLEHQGLTNHRPLEATGDQRHEDQQTNYGEHYEKRLRGVDGHESPHQQTGRKNTDGEVQVNSCEDGSLKGSKEGVVASANLASGSVPDVVTSFNDNIGEDIASGILGRNDSRSHVTEQRECPGKIANTLDSRVSSFEPKDGKTSSVIRCSEDVCGSSFSSRQKKPRSLNLFLSERYRSITSLSKQTVKTLWRRLEEEESARPPLDRFRLKHVGGCDRKKVHCKLAKTSSLLQPCSQGTVMQQRDGATVPHTKQRSYMAGLSQTGLLPQKALPNTSNGVNSIEGGGDGCEKLQISEHEQQILKQCQVSPENGCPDSLKMVHPHQESVSDYQSQGVFCSDSGPVRVSQCQCHDTIDTSCVSSNTLNEVKTFPSTVTSDSGGFVSISPTLHSLSSLVASPDSNNQIMASSVRFSSNTVHPTASEFQFPSQTPVPFCSVTPSVAIGFPQSTTTTYSFPQIPPISSTSPLASFITQPPLLMRQTIPQSSLMQTNFITRYHPQHELRPLIMQPTIANTSLRLCQPFNQHTQGSSTTTQDIVPCVDSSSVGSSSVSAQLATTSTVLQPIVSLGPESWTVAPQYSHQHQHSSCNTGAGGIIASQCHEAGEPVSCAGVAVQVLGNQQCPAQQQYHLAATAGVSSSASSYSLHLYHQATQETYHE